MSSLEMAWMAAMIAEDENEEFKKKLEFADYSASFINPQGVEQVRAARDTTKRVDTDDFVKSIERISGRAAPISR